jgi:hypothetical protein
MRATGGTAGAELPRGCGPSCPPKKDGKWKKKENRIHHNGGKEEIQVSQCKNSTLVKKKWMKKMEEKN